MIQGSLPNLFKMLLPGGNKWLSGGAERWVPGRRVMEGMVRDFSERNLGASL